MDEKNMGKIFCKNTAAIICLLIAIFCSSGSSLADMREAELFEKAYEYYLAFNPEKALETFDLFLQQYPDSSALDSILFWRAKSLMQMKRVDEAAKSFRKLREVFPESSYSLFAEKELETLKGLLQKADKSDAVREKTAKTSEAKTPAYEERIRKLETEKNDLEKQLSEAEKKRQLTEKGLSKALDDKNILESQLDELKRKRDDLTRREAAQEKGIKESSRLAEEKRALESRIKVNEEKLAGLSLELARSEEKITALTRELSAKIQQGQKDLEKLDLQIKELKTGNTSLDQTVKEKDRALSDAMQSLSALQKKIADSESSKQREYDAALAKAQAERDGLQSQIRTLETRDRERNDLALRAEDTKKLREEMTLRTAELEKLKKENSGLLADRQKIDAALRERDQSIARQQEAKTLLEKTLKGSDLEKAKQSQELESLTTKAKDALSQLEDSRKKQEELTKSSVLNEKEVVKLKSEKTELEVKLRDLQEKARTLTVVRDKDEEKERNALLVKSQELEKKVAASEISLRQFIEERQNLEIDIKEREQKLAKALDSLAMLEKRAKESDKEKETTLLTLNDKTVRSAQEKAALEEELKKEKKKAAELSSRNSENEAALLREIKLLEKAKQDLDTRDREKRELAEQIAEARKSREEIAGRISQADKIEKDNKRLLEEKRGLEQRLRETDEKIMVVSSRAEGDKDKEIKAISEKLKEADKRQKDSDLALKKSHEERQAAEVRMQEQQARITKSQESIALLEKTIKGTEQEKEKKLQELNERIRITEAEKKDIGEDLARERKKTADLSGKGTEKEAALVHDIKTLESSRQDLQSRLAAEKLQRESDFRKFEAERADLQARLKDFESRTAQAKDAAAQLENSRKQQEEQARVSALNEKELVKLKSEKAELAARLSDLEEKAKSLSVSQRAELAGNQKQGLERMLSEKEAQITKAGETITLLQKSLRELEQEKVLSVKAAQEMIRKSGEEKKSLEEELKKEKASVTALSVRKAEYEAADRKEVMASETAKREFEQKLTEERARSSSEAQKIRSERDELKKQMQAAESLRKEKDELAAQLEEMKRMHADAQSRIGKAENPSQDNRNLLEEKRQLEIQIRGYEEKITALSSELVKSAAADREQKDLSARLDEQEKKVRDQQALVSRLMVEKGTTERELKEGREALAAMRAVKEGRDLLQAEVDQIKVQKQQMQTELADMKRVNEQHAKRNAELAGKASPQGTQLPDYDKPFLRIGKEQYSLAVVMRDGITARNVTDKIQAKNIPWRTGNIIDDFITEQILAQNAQIETVAVDASMKESLVKQHALTAAESAYLDRYLTIDRLIRKRAAVTVITEKEAREYYDKHREQYLHGRENRIRVLSLKFGKSDELEKSIIAVEMHDEALEGRSFDAIARKRSAIASMKEMPLSRLPDWARTKIAALKEGEISNIISADNEFMIIQAIPSKPAYRAFEEVRREIEKKLSAEQPGLKQSLEDWLSSLKKDAEFLR